MGGATARRRRRSTRDPGNSYASAAPDFAMLASLYPSFRPFVSFSRGRASIHFTDFAATPTTTATHPPPRPRRQLVGGFPMDNFALLFPNRSNYIHWIDDLLSSDLVPPISSSSETVRGFDIGTDANCIYPLLGASLLRWNFVGSDVADVALEWAKEECGEQPTSSRSN